MSRGRDESVFSARTRASGKMDRSGGPAKEEQRLRNGRGEKRYCPESGSPVGG